MKDKPEIILNTNSDALTYTPQLSHVVALYVRDGWLHCPKQKRAREPHMLKRLTDDSRFERADVCCDIWQLRHG
jgi:hypothetical protein